MTIQTPNRFIGYRVQVDVSDDMWFVGTVAYGGGNLVKVNGPDDRPELTDWYSTLQVTVLED